MLFNTDNAFRKYTIDCKNLLFKGKNKLKIIIENPFHKGLAQYHQDTLKYPAIDDKSDTIVRPYIRKPAYHFGSDWAPRIIDQGITGGVQLLLWNEVSIQDIKFSQRHISKDSAVYSVSVDLNAQTTGFGKLEIRHRETKELIIEKPVEIFQGKNSLKAKVVISQPKFWWPRGIGQQPLYTFETRILIDKKPIDVVSKTIGIRKVAFVQQTDSLGTSFQFKINDSLVYLKGTSYLPQKYFIQNRTDEELQHLITRLTDSHHNTIRISGHTRYESDAFYDLCDQNGILVWQDFMFSKAMYPGHDDFIYTAKKEVTEQIRRLRHHPSIIHWCGNEQIELGWNLWGWQHHYQTNDSTRYWNDYQRLFQRTIPHLVTKLDGERSYSTSSPLSSQVNQEEQGTWTSWQQSKAIQYYQKYSARFASSFGFKSYPSAASLSIIDKESFERHKKYYQYHSSKENIQQLIAERYGPAKTWKGTIFLSQLLQAEELKEALENCRSNAPYCGGSIYNYFNDNSPAVSTSILENNLRPKVAYYAVKKCYDKILPVIKPSGDSLLINIYSDSLEDTESMVDISIRDFNNTILLDTLIQKSIQPFQENFIFSLKPKDFFPPYKSQNYYLHVEVRNQFQSISWNTLYFGKEKYQKLAIPEINSKIDRVGKLVKLTYSSPHLIRNLNISSRVDGTFSHNNFDLIPGYPLSLIHI